MKQKTYTRYFYWLFSFIVIITFGCDDNPASSTLEPVAYFTCSGETKTPAYITFQNESENADSYHWDFGNGRTSSLKNPSTTYDYAGSFIVSLEAENEESGEKDTYRQTITITPGSVFLKQITIEDFSFTTGSGAGWDLWSGPDLFIRLFDPFDDLITESTTAYDLIESDLPISFYFNDPYELDYWSSSYCLELYDEDDISLNEYIGSVDFRVNSIISNDGYSERTTLWSSDHSITIELELDWE
ncbi:PKD domain-containing protein [bacterium]|nr:PKD domain-containing protein [bacterium]